MGEQTHRGARARPEASPLADESAVANDVADESDSEAMTHADLDPKQGPRAGPAGHSGPVPSRPISQTSSRPSDASIPQPDAAVGTLLAGRYRIEKQIAKGGMGRVYLATQLTLERRVAVKLISPRTDVVSDPLFVRRFFLEAAICARLSHANIVTVHDYGEAENGLVFMAMEYLDGTPLSTAIKEHGAIAQDRAILIAIQICRGLREAHANGVVHRDLKPGNIMLLRGRDEENRDIVKVLDFGLVKVFEPSGDSPLLSADLGESFDLTRAGILLGSPRYMSPEQIRNEALDPRTDVYSLGVILYQMVAARTPFNGKTSVDILHQHLHQPPPPVEGLAPELAGVILRCLEKHRDARYPSISDLLRDLKNVYRVIAPQAPGALNVSPLRFGSSSGVLSGSMSSSRPDVLDPSNRSSDSIRLTTGDLSGSMRDSASLAPVPIPPAAPLAEPIRAAPASSAASAQPDESTSDHLLSARRAIARAPADRGRRFVAAGATLAVVAGAIGAYVALDRGGPEGAPPSRAAAAGPRAPTLTIESRPSGATVREGGRVLGQTPLAFPLEPGASAERSFDIALDGYVPYTFRQMPAVNDVRMIAELVEVDAPAEPGEPAEPAPRVIDAFDPPRSTPETKAARPRRLREKVKPAKVPPGEEQEPDIRLER